MSSIVPLPVFEADGDPHHRDVMSDSELYAQLEAPKTIVVRYGLMKQVAEFPHDGDAKPGCGTKLVARTNRGTEVVEMLTTTCENAGCSKSVTRQEMLDYIENSGGREYPFRTDGRILHVATIEELNKQSALMSDRARYIKACKGYIEELGLDMKLVEVEPILGEELLTFYFMSGDRVDFRGLVRKLAAEFKTRIEMRQVGARDEARLVADYERCGQHCCCKNFLKVLRPVSMKSAKLQKATLDPLKISGRCGRLMCCLRYEDQTYDELRKRLPNRNKRVGTPEGPGTVLETKILVQLALIRLEHDDREIVVAIEDLMDPDACPKPGEKQEPDPLRGLTPEQVKERTDDGKRRRRGGKRGGRGKPTTRAEQQDKFRGEAQAAETPETDAKERKPRRRRGRRKGPRPETAAQDKPAAEQPPKTDTGDGAPKKKRRRRRRRGKGGGGGGTGGSDSK